MAFFVLRLVGLVVEKVLEKTDASSTANNADGEVRVRPLV